MPVARRVLGESHELTLNTDQSREGVRTPAATPTIFRYAVATLEDAAIARRVLAARTRSQRRLRPPCVRASGVRARETPADGCPGGWGPG